MHQAFLPASQPQRRRLRNLGAGTGVALALLLSACGGDDSGAAAEPAVTTDGGASQSAGSDTAATGTASEDGSPTTTTDGTTTDGVEAGDGTVSADPTPSSPIAIDLSSLDLEELPTGPPAETDPENPTEPPVESPTEVPVATEPAPTPRQVPIDSEPAPLETVVIDDDERDSAAPAFELDQNAALACANTEFALDALIASDAVELDRTLSQASEWATESTDPGMQDIASDLATVRDPEAAEQLVLSVLQACTAAGYEL